VPARNRSSGGRESCARFKSTYKKAIPPGYGDRTCFKTDGPCNILVTTPVWSLIHIFRTSKVPADCINTYSDPPVCTFKPLDPVCFEENIQNTWSEMMIGPITQDHIDVMMVLSSLLQVSHAHNRPQKNVYFLNIYHVFQGVQVPLRLRVQGVE
jgi:hypothetical protein